ncbi:hypothetical protein V1264_000533 [Littorina saxatilis]|uniref:G-protein coupled receptors family 1 profile domain-containing protein n=1 Tax=Littorina saxatilis TaxID=31220 RepID=A0AAN9C016_9CAEN
MDSTERTATNWSHEMVEKYLSQLSQESFKHRIPVVLYLILIIVVGLIGNVVVILVYWRRFKPCVTRVFVLAMAACDLICNTLGLPLQIMTIRYAYDIDGYWLCRSFFAIATPFTQASGFLLVLVALDRCHRICRPLKKQLNPGKAWVLVFGALCLSGLSFAPFVPLYGIHKVNTTQPGIQARMCWTEDTYQATIYPEAYKIVLGVFFFGGLCTMLPAYLLIGVRIWHLRKERLGLKRKMSQNSSRSHSLTETKNVLPMKTEVSSLKALPPACHQLNTQQDCQPLDLDGNAICVQDARDRKKIVVGSSMSDYTSSESCPSGHDNIPERTQCSSQPDGDTFQIDVTRNCAETPSDANSHQSRGVPYHIGTSQTQEACQTREACTDEHHSDDGDSEPNSGAPRPAPVAQQCKGKMEVQAGQQQSQPESARSDQKMGSSPHCLERLADKENGQPPKLLIQRGPQVSSRTRRIRSRTTLMMSVLTLCYVINWLPHLIMRFIRKDPVNWCPNLTDCSLSSNTYAIVIRSYYLNSVVNAFVYSFCNARFRQELKELFSTLLRKNESFHVPSFGSPNR